MRKFKFFSDCDKEETWLSEMLQKGYELESIYFGYKFHLIKKENASVRIDYRTFKKNEDFIDYCNMFEDSGWKHLVGSSQSGAQYFKNNGENKEDNIFSDSISKAEKYIRLSNIQMTFATVLFMLSSAVISSNYDIVKSLLNPKLLYLTPGLWERTGTAFWGRFLFETPFAIMRSFIYLLPLAMVIYIFLLIKSRMLYKKQKKSNY